MTTITVHIGVHDNSDGSGFGTLAAATYYDIDGVQSNGVPGGGNGIDSVTAGKPGTPPGAAGLLGDACAGGTGGISLTAIFGGPYNGYAGASGGASGVPLPPNPGGHVGIAGPGRNVLGSEGSPGGGGAGGGQHTINGDLYDDADISPSVPGGGNFGTPGTVGGDGGPGAFATGMGVHDGGNGTPNTGSGGAGGYSPPDGGNGASWATAEAWVDGDTYSPAPISWTIQNLYGLDIIVLDNGDVPGGGGGAGSFTGGTAGDGGFPGGGGGAAGGGGGVPGSGRNGLMLIFWQNIGTGAGPPYDNMTVFKTSQDWEVPAEFDPDYHEIWLWGAGGDGAPSQPSNRGGAGAAGGSALIVYGTIPAGEGEPDEIPPIETPDLEDEELPPRELVPSVIASQRWFMRTGHIRKWGNVSMDDLKLIIKRGVGSNETEPKIMVRVNRDNKGFGNWKKRGLGKQGDRVTTMTFGGFGTARDWQFEFCCTDDCDIELQGALARVTPLG